MAPPASPRSSAGFLRDLARVAREEPGEVAHGGHVPAEEVVLGFVELDVLAAAAAILNTTREQDLADLLPDLRVRLRLARLVFVDEPVDERALLDARQQHLVLADMELNVGVELDAPVEPLPQLLQRDDLLPGRVRAQTLPRPDLLLAVLQRQPEDVLLAARLFDGLLRRRGVEHPFQLIFGLLTLLARRLGRTPGLSGVGTRRGLRCLRRRRSGGLFGVAAARRGQSHRRQREVFFVEACVLWYAVFFGVK